MSPTVGTLENNNSGTGKFFLLSILLLMIVIGIFWIVVSHAERHGEDAVIADLCMNRFGPSQTWFKTIVDNRDNSIQNYRGFVCRLPDGKWYVIVEKLDTDGVFKNVTSFLRRLISGRTKFTVEEIVEYMKSNSWQTCIGCP